MGHPWPSAANPASCRVTHGFKPAFGQRVFMGRLRSRSRSKASDQKIADFVSGKDVRARSKTKRGGLTADLIVEAVPGSNVGGGLPPIAVWQSQMHWLTHRYREQAPSHILTAVNRRNSGRVQGRQASYNPRFCSTPLRPAVRPQGCKGQIKNTAKRGGLTAGLIGEAVLGSNVGGGLLPIAVGQLQMHWLTHRYREQVPSHILTAVNRRNSGRVQGGQASRNPRFCSTPLRPAVRPPCFAFDFDLRRPINHAGRTRA